MPKRVLIAVSVPDEWDKDSIADMATIQFCTAKSPVPDPTVWEWPDFWADHRDQKVTALRDGTASSNHQDVRWTSVNVDDLAAVARRAVRAHPNQLIQAIKEVRGVAHVSLKEAKDAVDLVRSAPPPKPPQFSSVEEAEAWMEAHG